MIAEVRAKARELLESHEVECVIGYERATDGMNARPAFVYEPAEVDRLIFDQTCTHSLVKYLLDKKASRTAVVAKGCDTLAINLLLNEKQIEREKLFVIGVVCPGVVETSWCRVSDRLQERCEACRQHNPLVYDLLVGEPVVETSTDHDPFANVREFEAKSPEERAEFWREQSERCLRCYGCRAVCPGCYCSECFVEQLDPLWVGIRVATPENWMWHTVRAFHLSGRCVGCDECQRVCPVGIPLSSLNRKLEMETLETFDFHAGLDPEATPPFATFQEEELREVGQ